uniref:RING-type domain-containing protein n=1 Tax=Strongyloides papillosus TaxID=174720 RepID=A0A0N5CA16_STREA
MGNCLSEYFGNNSNNSHERLGDEGNQALRENNHDNRSAPTSYVNELYISSQAAIQQQEIENELQEQKRRARITGLLEQIPIEKYDEITMSHCDECTICMMEFTNNTDIRTLPCKHIYHSGCIDDWLLRTFACPMCMTPVDSSILTSFTANIAGSDLSSISCNSARIGTSLR